VPDEHAPVNALPAREQILDVEPVPEWVAKPAPLPRLTAVTEPERIASIDVLRGFALLGILVMNIQSFAMPVAAYSNPRAYGDLTGANYAVWLLSHVLADQKFMTIFSMLFGSGIVLMTGRRDEAGLRPAGAHYRRMGALALFGLLHAYLAWYGDILFSYALCGMVVFLFRKVRPRFLILLGLLLLAIRPGVLAALDWITSWSPEFLKLLEEGWKPPAEAIRQEIQAYRGSWLQGLQHRWLISFMVQTFGFLLLTAWRAGGLMLVGMGLYKLGVFSLRRSRAEYVALIAVALLVGVPIILYGVLMNERAAWYVGYAKFTGAQFNYWGSILVSLGWVGVIMLICGQPRLVPLTRPLAAVGQMALTNYLMHTVICTTLFYGFGFFGQLERIGQIGIVLAIWTLQLIVSPIWLHYFRFGPAEWVWRALTYLKLPPMRRAAKPVV
jgi:uncharacterized protein